MDPRRGSGQSNRACAAITGVAPLIGGLVGFGVLALFALGLTTQTPQVAIIAGVAVLLCIISGFVAMGVLRNHPYFHQKSVAPELTTPSQSVD